MCNGILFTVDKIATFQGHQAEYVVKFQISNHYLQSLYMLNPTALRKAKIVYNFGLSECNRVNPSRHCETVNKNPNFLVHDSDLKITAWGCDCTLWNSGTVSVIVQVSTQSMYVFRRYGSLKTLSQKRPMLMQTWNPMPISG